MSSKIVPLSSKMKNQQFEYLSKEIFKKVKKAEKVLLATHENADGDAVSSLCAISLLLDDWKKDYYCYCPTVAPEQFNYLPNFEKIKTNFVQQSFSDFDVIIFLDCAVVARSGLEIEATNRHHGQILISFDHHPETEKKVNFDLRNDNAASTTEVIYDFLTANQIVLNKNLANCLLTGILTDTANFLYPSTSIDTVKIASSLLSAGANLFQIVKSTWQNKSLEAMKIWGTALINLQINEKYNLAYSVITSDDIGQFEKNELELDGIAGFLSNLYGVKAILFLYEEKPGLIKGSLRTAQPDVDVSRLARHLGGGGHAKASGFKIEGRLANIETGWRIY